MRNVLIQELIALRAEKNNVFLMTGDLGRGVLEPFSERYPQSFLNMGVSEQNMISVAAGLSRQGFLPFVYTINNFATFRCLEQIRNDLCYHNLPSVIVGIGQGYAYGALGYTHHGIEDISIMRALPHLSLLVPADPLELRYMMRHIQDFKGPVYLKMGGQAACVRVDDYEMLSFQKPRTVQCGEKIAICVTGEILHQVQSLLVRLKDQLTFQPTLLSCSTLKPFARLSDDIFKTHHTLISLEEHVGSGGLGSIILEKHHEQLKQHHVNFISISAPETPSSYTGDRNFFVQPILEKLERFLRESSSFFPKNPIFISKSFLPSHEDFLVT